MKTDITSHAEQKHIRVHIGSRSHGLTDIRNLWSRSVRQEWMIVLFLGTTCLYSGRTIMPVSSIYISNELHWNRRETGTVLGAFFWGYTMTQFLGGYLSDIHGGELVISSAAIGWASICIIFPLIPSFVSDPQWLLICFLAARMVQGLFQGFHYPSVGSMMAHRVAVKDRSFTYSFQSSGSHLGTLISGCVGSLLVEHFGWRIPFIVIGLAGFGWTTFLRTVMLRRRQRTLSGSAKRSINHDVERQPIPWKQLLTKIAFWAMVIAHYCHANAYFILLSWLPSYFHDNFPDAKGWIFNVVPWLIAIPSAMCSGLISDKLLSSGYSATFVRKLMTTFSLLGPGVFLILITLVTSYEAVLFCMAAAIACCGFHTSGIQLNPQDIAPAFGGGIFGLMNMAGAIPGFVGVYITGYILETTKSWNMVFSQTSGFCICGWIVYMIFGTGQKLI